MLSDLVRQTMVRSVLSTYSYYAKPAVTVAIEALNGDRKHSSTCKAPLEYLISEDFINNGELISVTGVGFTASNLIRIIGPIAESTQEVSLLWSDKVSAAMHYNPAFKRSMVRNLINDIHSKYIDFELFGCIKNIQGDNVKFSVFKEIQRKNITDLSIEKEGIRYDFKHEDITILFTVAGALMVDVNSRCIKGTPIDDNVTFVKFGAR